MEIEKRKLCATCFIFFRIQSKEKTTAICFPFLESTFYEWARLTFNNTFCTSCTAHTSTIELFLLRVNTCTLQSLKHFKFSSQVLVVELNIFSYSCLMQTVLMKELKTTTESVNAILERTQTHWRTYKYTYSRAKHNES